jgi:hypothetical protein
MDDVRKGGCETHYGTYWAMDELGGRSSRPRMVRTPARGRTCLSFHAIKTGDAFTVMVSWSSETDQFVAEHNKLTSDANVIGDSTTALELHCIWYHLATIL